MLELYVKMLKSGLDDLIEKVKQSLGIEDKEDIRIIIKIERGAVGAYLFNKSKFVRVIPFEEIVETIV